MISDPCKRNNLFKKSKKRIMKMSINQKVQIVELKFKQNRSLFLFIGYN